MKASFILEVEATRPKSFLISYLKVHFVLLKQGLSTSVHMSVNCFKKFKHLKRSFFYLS